MDNGPDICCRDQIYGNVVRTDIPLSAHSDFHSEILISAKKVWSFPPDFKAEEEELDHRVQSKENTVIFDFLDYLLREKCKAILIDINPTYVKSAVFANCGEEDPCFLIQLNICIGLCFPQSCFRRISGCYCKFKAVIRNGGVKLITTAGAEVVAEYNVILINFLSWIRENYPSLEIYQKYSDFKKRPDFEFLKFHIQSNYRYLMRNQFLIKSGLTHFSETEEYPPLNR